MEECCTEQPILSSEEKMCEDIFVKTTKREIDGKFRVDIPLKNSVVQLGDSKRAALSRFRNLESKLQKSSNLKKMYVDFMTEYISLGHMSRVDESVESEAEYYLPHHGVVNENSSTTKLRVVFDASCPTDSGVSFNDIQCVGPTIQSDLLSIIIRFRQHKIVVGADIEKMYRMVNVNPNQRSLQRIFWRADPGDVLGIYNLNTVTYGTASAPFLAVRCLKQLAIDHASKFPDTCKVISKDFYVDDLISGADSVENAVRLCSEVSAILKTASFNLRKWSSNNLKVLQQIQSFDSTASIMQFGEKSNTKLLGLYWSCESDSLKYNIKTPPCTSVTKRTLLSDISRIFDPLGLLSPSIVLVKIILQRLWTLKLSWDESLPCDLHNQWQQYRNQISELNQLQIKRHVVIDKAVVIELHGFADASQDAYGACVYIGSINSNNEIFVSLLCAKSKVAPLKSTTIPRLEFCACLLLAQLINKVISSLNLNIRRTFLWSDSTVVLSWIKTSPHLLNIFVANRVSQIQGLSDISLWRHVCTKSNPADLVSRGLSPEKLVNSSLWWFGPAWLSSEEASWPESKFLAEFEIPELKRQTQSLVLINDSGLLKVEYYSSLSRLKRVVAYCLRFLNNCKNPETRITGCLTAQELTTSLEYLLKLSQRETFPEEYFALSTKGNVSKKSKLLCLNPFIDSSGLIRVGGRLQNSKLGYDGRHPIILSAKHHLVQLLFISEHKRLLHAGPQQMLSSIRENYWPISGKNLTKQIVHQCVRCYRVRPKIVNPLMGGLPKGRVQPIGPFHNVGVDYAGPVFIKDKRGRGSRLTKGYICLFICFATKAIHLELVSDLTKEGFIATFRRFVSRRGCPESVYSDNGLNFVGANTELKELGVFLRTEEKTLVESFQNQGVNWHFIPPHSPHFGGLWEAGVKSTKTHLKRVIADARLTFEDMLTVLTQIEAVLNSRPLFPLSSDPMDLDILTPAHFLVGRRLTSNPDVRDIPLARLSRFQYMQQIQQHFWDRWSKEYLHQLQVRHKWKSDHSSMKIGDLVLIKEDHLPPLSWKLGRIIETHPGKDEIVRVVSVKTKSGVVKRSFAKICPLPISE